jgi:hypothetical protein
VCLLTVVIGLLALSEQPSPIDLLELDAKAHTVGDSVCVTATITNLSRSDLSTCIRLSCNLVRNRMRSDSGVEIEGEQVWNYPYRVSETRVTDGPQFPSLVVGDLRDWKPSRPSNYGSFRLRIEGPPCSQIDLSEGETWADSVMVPFEDDSALSTVETVRVTVQILIAAPGSEAADGPAMIISDPMVVSRLAPNSPLQPSPATGSRIGHWRPVAGRGRD